MPLSERPGAHSIAYELRRLILLSTLPLVGLIALFGYLGYQETRGTAEASVQRQATRVALDVTRFLRETEAVLQRVATRAPLQRVESVPCDPILAELSAIQPRYASVIVSDRVGRVICGTAPPRGGPRGFNASGHDWFQAVQTGKALALGAIDSETIPGRWTAMAAVPVRAADGSFAGALSVAIDLVRWEPSGASNGVLEDAVFGVLDSSGAVIMRFPEAEKWVGRNRRDSQIALSMLRIRDGVFAAPGVQGFERIWAVTPIPGTDWLAFSGIRASSVLGPALKEALIALLLALVALALAARLALSASRRLVRPITAIARTARNRASGSDDLVPVTGPSEIAEVAQELNRMILARRQTESALRKLSRAVEQSPASIVITDRAGTIEYVNPRFEQVTGYSRTEAIGSNPRILRSGVVPDETYAQLWAAISGGGEWMGELCNRKKNGELFWEFAAISGIRGENGEIEHYVGVKEDITERKAAETKFRRLSNLYAALSQCNRAVVHCTREQELFEQVCSAIVNFGGMKLAWIGLVDAASKRVLPVASHGDDTGYLADIEVSVDPDKPSGRGPGGTAIRNNQPVWSQDFLHDASTEPWRERARRAGWQSVAAVPLCRNGMVIGALSLYSPELNAFDEAVRNLVAEMAANIGFALDHFVHEARRRAVEESLLESESRLSAVFQASPIGSVVTRIADGKILDINDAALRMCNLAREEVIGRTMIEVGIYADPAQREELLAQLRAHGQVDRLEVDFRKRGGALGKAEVTGRVIELRGERCLVTMSVDVTERKRLEEVHLRAQKLESLGTLAGGIAHDFNNILAAIRGNAEMAAQDIGPDHIAAQSLREIGKASARAHDLVRRIMTFARSREAGHEVVALAAVVEEVLKLLRPTLPASISLSMDFGQDVPLVRADVGQVHEAIVNLTTNSAYAIGAHVGSIEYRLESVDVGEALARNISGIKPGRFARLTVSDSGCGMDAPVLERIFDAFYTTKPVGEGTGLGLSMVHGIMKSHGGAVSVESSPGKGANFALYFPAAVEGVPTPEKKAPASTQSAAGQRVLYVDDEDALVSLAVRMLSRLGHDIAGFSDPEEALAAFRAQPQDFDVVVTDLSMPHMSGLELAREVLSVRPEMTVLMTTGYLRPEDEISAREAGIREVVLKPATMDELGQVLDRMFRRSRS